MTTRVAAIDCGTNSVRLLVADLPAGDGSPDAPLVALVRRMEVVRLGQGVDRTGRLAPEALARTRAALADYAAEIERLGAQRVRMVATSASRDAANADEFTAMVTDLLGVTPEVVTGEEEARLSYVGAVRGLAEPGPHLVVDIGGGSTEFVLGSRVDQHDAAMSVDVGCVRITERHLHHDPPTAAEVAAAEADITAAVDRALAHVCGEAAIGGSPAVGGGGGAGGAGGATMIGLAGSVTTVAALALGLPSYLPERIHHARISAGQAAEVTGRLLAQTRQQRLVSPVMHPGRADVIGGGALVLRIAMARAGASAVIASEHDILDGIAWSLAAPVSGP